MGAELIKKIKYAAVALAMAAFSAAMTTVFTDTASQWYQDLKKSVLEPPWIAYLIIFGMNYLFCAASLFITLLKKRTDRILYGFILNFVLLPLWNYIYFQKQNALSALVLLLIVLPTAVYNAINAFKISKPAGLLMLPQTAGVGFILLLNYSVYMLN